MNGWFLMKFPTRANREFIRTEQGFFRIEQMISGSDQGIDA
jgi:hypothetical protein